MIEFKLGDMVEIKPNTSYNLTTGGQQGKIVSIDISSQEYEIEFSPTTWKQMHDNASRITPTYTMQRTFWINQEALKVIQDPVNKLTPVEQRIKNLWNNSNYVLKNPKLMY